MTSTEKAYELFKQKVEESGLTLNITTTLTETRIDLAGTARAAVKFLTWAEHNTATARAAIIWTWSNDPKERRVRGDILKLTKPEAIREQLLKLRGA